MSKGKGGGGRASVGSTKNLPATMNPNRNLPAVIASPATAFPIKGPAPIAAVQAEVKPTTQQLPTLPPKTVKVSRREVGAILNATFPDYKGKKISMEIVKPDFEYQMENYWDGGTRSYVKALSQSGRVSSPSGTSTSPFNKLAHARVPIPKDTMLVEHQFFMGKDVGVRIYVRGDSPILTGSLGKFLK